MGVPGIAYVLADVFRRRPSQATVQRVARLSDLKPGRPVQVGVVGSRRDAWTVYPDEVIGHVWLVRRDTDPASDAAADKQPTVAAFTSVCPHLGCTIGLDATGRRFVCPCHRAEFALDGQRVGNGNHAPRAMDGLECRLVRDDDADDWWVEIAYEKFERGLTRKVRRA